MSKDAIRNKINKQRNITEQLVLVTNSRMVSKLDKQKLDNRLRGNEVIKIATLKVRLLSAKHT